MGTSRYEFIAEFHYDHEVEQMDQVAFDALIKLLCEIEEKIENQTIDVFMYSYTHFENKDISDVLKYNGVAFWPCGDIKVRQYNESIVPLFLVFLKEDQLDHLDKLSKLDEQSDYIDHIDLDLKQYDANVYIE